MRMREYDELVARHEAMVDDPGYQWRVRLWMWFGSFVLLLGVLVVAGLAAAFIALLFVGKAWFFLIKGLKLVIALVVGIGAFVKSMWVKFPAPEGEELSEKGHPKLFERLRSIAAESDSVFPDRVVLTDEMNAGVSSNRIIGPLPIYRHTLVLGLPLMDALSPEEFDSVIGHEFGHLSRSHAAFGGKVYRTRLTWLRVQEHIDLEEGFGGLGGRFIAWYAPRFAAMTHALARKNEYEADRSGAIASSISASVDALARLRLAESRADAELWTPIQTWPLEYEEPPSDIFDMHADIVRKASADPRAPRWLEEAKRAYTDSTDTHPSLLDRAKALGAPVRVPPSFEGSAAEAYLADSLRHWRTKLNRGWQEARRGQWAVLRKEQRNCVEALEQLEAIAPEERTTQDLIALVDNYLSLHRNDDAKEALALLCEREPEMPDAAMQYGRLLLIDGDAAGIPWVERAIALEPEWGLSGQQLIALFHRQQGDREAADAAFENAEGISIAAAEYAAKVNAIEQDEPLEAHHLPDGQLEAFLALVAPDERVKRAWIVARPVTEKGERPHVILLELKPPFSTLDKEAFYAEVIQHYAHAVDFIEEPALLFRLGAVKWLDKKVNKLDGARVYGN